jgi:hypothetical protein
MVKKKLVILRRHINCIQFLYCNVIVIDRSTEILAITHFNQKYNRSNKIIYDEINFPLFY